jgi:phage terminase small subunit
MALAGRKPKATHLKLVQGNPGKRALPEGEPETNGPLGDKPKYLRGRAAVLWSEVSNSCWWLGNADTYKLGLWCALQAELERAPAKMVAARIAQLRAVGSELGLDPASRTRLNVAGKGRSKIPEGKPKDEFFDD